MAQILAFLSGKKTYLAALYGVIAGAMGLAGVSIPGIPALAHDAAVQAILTALTGAFLRAGVAKTGK